MDADETVASASGAMSTTPSVETVSPSSSRRVSLKIQDSKNSIQSNQNNKTPNDHENSSGQHAQLDLLNRKLYLDQIKCKYIKDQSKGK